MVTQKVTRTINPLHFEDLEPHRFEDLVRQLVYDYRRWSLLEATGRLGADQGIDIRATEIVSPDADHSGLGDEYDQDRPDEGDEQTKVEHDPARTKERIWTIQCKREKVIGPKQVAAIVRDAIPSDAPPPHGFIIAAACNFSLKSRDRFRERVRELGVQEHQMWGKAELEDMLFQPKYDHLLFAYFGISLLIRRRSARSRLGARLMIKRRLVKLFGPIGRPEHSIVLLKDVDAPEYPHPNPKRLRWRYFNFVDHLSPDHIAVKFREYYAWADPKNKEWDAFFQQDAGWPQHPQVYGLDKQRADAWPLSEKLRRYWYANIPPENRALFLVYGFIHYDRILALDEIGDMYNQGPHIIIERQGARSPFDWSVKLLEYRNGRRREGPPLSECERVDHLPKDVPDVKDEDFDAGIRAK